MTTTIDERGGLHAHLVDPQGYIRHEDWSRCALDRTAVGRCRRRRCDGWMLADRATTDGKTVWYQARCNKCGGEIATPDGRVIARSGEHRLMPAGAWDRRITILTRMRDLAKGEA